MRDIKSEVEDRSQEGEEGGGVAMDEKHLICRICGKYVGMDACISGWMHYSTDFWLYVLMGGGIARLMNGWMYIFLNGYIKGLMNLCMQLYRFKSMFAFDCAYICVCQSSSYIYSPIHVGRKALTK